MTLEEITSVVFSPISGTPMDELFARYMYFLRAKEGNKSTTTEALRKFYERNKYQYLKQSNTISELKKLALFWRSVFHQDKERFSIDILKKLFVLNYAPNGMWQNIVSVYFLTNKDEDGLLENNAFLKFLDKITGFIFTYAITNPGVNALRTPIYDEMITIIQGAKIDFGKYKFNENQARTSFENFTFTNQRSITRSMLTWYAFSFSHQHLLDRNEYFEIEHIYARKRQEMEKGLKYENSLESLGNKILLEESINIRSSDYRFEDKKKIYSGEQRRGKNKEASKIHEISEIIKHNDFTEENIISRSKSIIDKYFEFLRTEELLVI